MNAEIKTCSCSGTKAAQQQDVLYGQGKRAHNPTMTRTGDGVKYRCTVCGTVR